MSNLDAFNRQSYLNLETFRKSGVGVKTPVWFVQDGGILFVRTMTNSGKVKRILNNGNVNIAPCKADGTPVGNWIPATAREIKDNDTDKKVDRLLGKKYGLMKTFFSLASSLRKQEGTILEIKLNG
jgi:uncharacterized protein